MKSLKIDEDRCLRVENRSPGFLGSILRAPEAETGVKKCFSDVVFFLGEIPIHF